MTREEAWRKTKGYLYDVLSGEEADEIIKALEQESCGDIISRREAIKKFTYNYKGQRIPDYDCDNWPTQIDLITVRKYLRELPPVISQPKEKTGHWIILDDCEHFIAKCSECGEVEDSRMIIMYPYCHCGAKMQAENEG